MMKKDGIDNRVYVIRLSISFLYINKFPFYNIL